MQALLDKNCLVDLADGRQPFADQLEPVIAAWRRGGLELIAAAITASENQPDEVPPTWEQFKELLARAGLADVRTLGSTLTWGMGFWGEGLWADEEMIELERKIWAILPPKLDMDDSSSERWKWVNKKCDVMTVWTQVWHNTDVLLTRDAKMLGKAQALAALGARLELPARFAANL